MENNIYNINLRSSLGTTPAATRQLINSLIHLSSLTKPSRTKSIKLYSTIPFYLAFKNPRDNSFLKKNNFHNFRKKGYADITVLSRETLFNLKHVLVRTKKETLAFSLKEICDKKIFLDKVTNFIESGAIYFVLVKINYDFVVFVRKRVRARKKGYLETYEYVVFTLDPLELDYSENNVIEIEHLFDEITQQIQHLLEKYNISSQKVNYVELSFSKVDRKILSDLTYDPKSTFA